MLEGVSNATVVPDYATSKRTNPLYTAEHAHMMSAQPVVIQMYSSDNFDMLSILKLFYKYYQI